MFSARPGESVLWGLISVEHERLQDVSEQTEDPRRSFSSAESAVPVEFHFLPAGKMRASEEEKV